MRRTNFLFAALLVLVSASALLLAQVEDGFPCWSSPGRKSEDMRL